MGNNILVGADRKAKLTDFGLSVFAQNLNPQAAEPVGAVRWKAPERLGKVDSGPSFKSDIFSFGMFIVELLSGQLPWINIGLDAGVRQEVLRGKLLTAHLNSQMMNGTSRAECTASIRLKGSTVSLW